MLAYIVLGSIVVGLAVLAMLVVARRGAGSGAVGYMRDHGHCPNMGACDGCDVCQED